MVDKICLEEWFQYSYGLLYGNESTTSSSLYLGKKEFLNRMLVLGRKIFSLSSYATFNCLEKEIQNFFGLDADLSVEGAMIEIFLIFCVSENCEHRSLFLEQILELNEEDLINLCGFGDLNMEVRQIKRILALLTKLSSI